MSKGWKVRTLGREARGGLDSEQMCVYNRGRMESVLRDWWNSTGLGRYAATEQRMVQLVLLGRHTYDTNIGFSAIDPGKL